MTHMSGSEDDFQELAFLFHHMDPWDQTQVWGSKCQPSLA